MYSRATASKRQTTATGRCERITRGGRATRRPSVCRSGSISNKPSRSKANAPPCAFAPSIRRTDFAYLLIKRQHASTTLFFERPEGGVCRRGRTGRSERPGCFRGTMGSEYSKIAQSWRVNRAILGPYFKYAQKVRCLIYTTNAIEDFNRHLRKVTKAKSMFPTGTRACQKCCIWP